MGRWLARATSRTMLTHIRHVTPVPPNTATGAVAEVYRQLATDFGVYAPPVVLHSPAPEALRACWALLRETLLADGLVSRRAKEVVAEAVSLGNRCPYCVDVHGAAATGLIDRPGRHPVDRDPAADPELEALAEWGRRSGEPSDRPRPPFPLAYGPELIGVAVVFHYLNRMVHVFLQESPLPATSGPVRKVALRIASRVMGGLAGVGAAPGRSVDLLPPAPIPATLGWSLGQPHIAAAMARSTRAVYAAGTQVLPERIRALVLATVADPPATTLAAGAFFDAALTALPPDERPLGRLALLTALAPYRVTAGDITACRVAGADDRTLVLAAAWASLNAAHLIGAGLDNDLTAHMDGLGTEAKGEPGSSGDGGPHSGR